MDTQGEQLDGEGEPSPRTPLFDPRTKILATLALAFLVFAVGSPVVAAAQLLVFAALAALARIPPARIFPRPGFMAFVILMIVLMQALFVPETAGRYLINPIFPEGLPLVGGRGSVGLGGLVRGLAVAGRILALAILMPLLAFSTNAKSIARGVAALGAGYKAGFVVSSALNMVGAFEGELRRIIDARRLRGSVPSGFIGRLAEYRAVAVPLMTKAMIRASAVALLMDSRAFGAHRTRTWLRGTRMSAADFVALAAVAVFCAVSLWADRLLGS